MTDETDATKAPEEAGHEHPDEPGGELPDEPPPRVEEDAKEKILGHQYERQRFSENRATAPSVWGDGNIQNIFSARMASSFRRPADIDALADWYASTDEKEEKALRDALDRHTTVCLSGEPETGRFSTACVALLERFGPDRVEEIIPPPDQLPTEAVHQLSIEDVRPETGYLLRIEAGDPGPIISRLDALMHEGQARLVLIRNARARSAPHGDTEITHQSPQASEVFRAHVRRLGERSGTDVTGHLTLADTVPLPDKPRDVVWLAAEALRHTAVEARRIMVEQSVGHLRATAETVLGISGYDGRPVRRRLPQHRRAFLIAYAAMADQPIGYVFEATGRLLAKLDAESGWEDLGRTALEHSVAALLGDELAVAWRSGDNPRRLARVDDGLVRAIFDVAWHEFDHARPALLAWLDSMAEDVDVAFRNAAIRVVVELALLDFDGVWPSIIDRWSRSMKTRVRVSAAQAILILGSANRVKHLVARHVHRWVRGRSHLQRDTAAWAYAGGLLLSDPRWILADLRSIAADPKQKRGWIIAMAVSQLLSPELQNLIVRTLAEWVRADADDRAVTRHAARAFSRMLVMPLDDRPMLLGGLAAGAVERHDLLPLWYAAMLGDSTRHDSWNGLLVWLRHADTDPALRPPVVQMLRDLAKAPALRRRMGRLLSRPDAPEWITAVVEEWTR